MCVYLTNQKCFEYCTTSTTSYLMRDRNNADKLFSCVTTMGLDTAQDPGLCFVEQAAHPGTCVQNFSRGTQNVRQAEILNKNTFLLPVSSYGSTSSTCSVFVHNTDAVFSCCLFQRAICDSLQEAGLLLCLLRRRLELAALLLLRASLPACCC